METAKDFLNPSSMMTPGAAGALTMTVANTVTLQFGLAESWMAGIALSVSFLFGLLVLTAEAMPVWRKIVYYIINSLIIFTVAVGSNTLGGTAYASSPKKTTSHSPQEQHLVIDLIGIPSAYAHGPENGWCCLNNKVNQSSTHECEKWAGRFFATEEEARNACQPQKPKVQEKQERFFRPWF